MAKVRMTSIDNEVLRIKDAATLLNVHPDTLRRWANRGKVEAVRHPISGYRLFHKKVLIELMSRIYSRE